MLGDRIDHPLALQLAEGLRDRLANHREAGIAAVPAAGDDEHLVNAARLALAKPGGRPPRSLGGGREHCAKIEGPLRPESRLIIGVLQLDQSAAMVRAHSGIIRIVPRRKRGRGQCMVASRPRQTQRSACGGWR